MLKIHSCNYFNKAHNNKNYLFLDEDHNEKSNFISCRVYDGNRFNRVS